jgi:hypothetical protein
MGNRFAITLYDIYILFFGVLPPVELISLRDLDFCKVR